MTGSPVLAAGSADLVQLAINLGVPAVLLILGWSAGTIAERRHLASIVRRERALAGMLVTTHRSAPADADEGLTPRLVMGDSVVATDYFKSILAKLKKIIGGEVRSFHSLIDRARREAIITMLEQARAAGYDAVCAVRLESPDIGGSATQAQAQTTVAAFAFGTAYRRARSA